MTDYELSDLFLSHATSLLTYFMAFVSATSALLIVAYFAASGLPVRLARVIIGIYVTTSIFLITSFQRQTMLLIEIRDQMGPGMAWHTAVSEPSWVLPSMAWIGLATMIIILVSAIWYFHFARSHADENS